MCEISVVYLSSRLVVMPAGKPQEGILRSSNVWAICGGTQNCRLMPDQLAAEPKVGSQPLPLWLGIWQHPRLVAGVYNEGKNNS